MNSKGQIKRSDVLALIAIAILLLGNLAAIGTAGRERAKRTVCLSNLKHLTQAWRLFADDHNGQLVNGAAGIGHPSAEPWVGRCWASNYSSGGQLPEAIQMEEIKAGALWPYVEELKLYRCPSGDPGIMLTYAVVDSMFGLGRSGTISGGKGVRVDDTAVWVRNLNEIITPGPAKRMVFIDEGWIDPDSFATHYQRETWWNDPPAQHNDGVTVSFADGHTEYWQWRGADTIEHGRARTHVAYHRSPQTPEGKEDLHRLQRAVWRRLGYESTEP